ncbi:protein ACTIVITY OF BC1 COMPLEX KINASE 3, chloroplastic-like [Curcuma longa]|uniref:protein ACTIVITY OF BC1 COMPLEX KINASE 3, chloroplastic-like n=1 Tax=Curcuma longa TaxID=136217 RepID=UPI003D9E0A90
MAIVLSLPSSPYRRRMPWIRFPCAGCHGSGSNATVYSPQLLATKYSSRPLKVVSRTLEIFMALGIFALKLVMDQRQGKPDRRKRQRAAELTRTLARLGPTFVKIGQGLSTRPDICPPEYLDQELSKLQDGLPTFPNGEAFACIERELQVSAISTEPVAAASLGQVYKAQHKHSGKFVAVKVQRPEIEDSIGLDFYLLRSRVPDKQVCGHSHF